MGEENFTKFSSPKPSFELQFAIYGKLLLDEGKEKKIEETPYWKKEYWEASLPVAISSSTIPVNISIANLGSKAFQFLPSVIPNFNQFYADQ